MATNLKQPLEITPGAVVDISWDWSDWLPQTDSIAQATVTPPLGCSVSNVQALASRVVAFVTIDPATAPGIGFQVVCSIVTSSTPPRSDSRTITLIAARR